MKKKIIFLGGVVLVLLLSVAVTGCKGEIEYRDREVPGETITIDSRPDYEITFDRNEYVFIAPLGRTFNTPGALTVTIVNTGKLATGALNIKINKNAWLLDTDSKDPTSGTTLREEGSFFVNTAQLPSIAPGATGSFVIRVADFPAATATVPNTYWDPVNAEFIVSNANVSKTFKYTLGTASVGDYVVSACGTVFPAAPVVGTLVTDFSLMDMPANLVTGARFFTDNPSIVMRGNDGAIRFVGEGEANIGFVSGNGVTENWYDSPTFQEDPFVVYYGKVNVGPAVAFRIESAVTVPSSYSTSTAANSNNVSTSIMVNFTHPVTNLDPFKFAALVSDWALAHNSPRVSPVLGFYPGLPTIDRLTLRFVEAEKMDAAGKQWRLKLGPQDPWNTSAAGRSYIRFHAEDIIRLATIEEGAAIHADSAVPLPKINEFIVHNNLNRAQWATEDVTEQQFIVQGMYYAVSGWNNGPARATVDINAIAETNAALEDDDPDKLGYKVGDQYFLQNALIWIGNRHRNIDGTQGTRNNLTGGNYGVYWNIALNTDQVIDEGLGRDFPPSYNDAVGGPMYNSWNSFRWSQVRITVTDKVTAPVRVTWADDVKWRIRAWNGLTIWLDGKGAPGQEGKLIFDANNNNVERWFGTESGGRMIAEGGVVFENADINVAYEGSDSYAGLIRVDGGGNGASSLIFKNAIVRDNKISMWSKDDDTGELWLHGGIVAPITIAGDASVFVMYDGQITGNTVEIRNAKKRPNAGGVGFGAPWGGRWGNWADESAIAQNHMMYMTGGSITGNTTTGGTVMVAGGILGAGSFQKTGGVVGSNTVTEPNGNFGGPQIAVVIAPMFPGEGESLQGRNTNKPASKAALFAGNAGADVQLFVDWGSLDEGMKIPKWF
jgi:hypothetical protein